MPFCNPLFGNEIFSSDYVDRKFYWYGLISPSGSKDKI